MMQLKRWMFFMLPAAMLLMASCKETNQPSGLSVDPELITCPDVGGDYTISVTSPNGAWTASSSESWVRLSPESGEQGTSEVRIKIMANKESAESSAKIVFSAGEETLTLPITRAAKAAPYLRIVSELSYNTPKEGGSYTIQVESNIKWSASSNASWAKVSKGVSVNNDNITIAVSPATMPEETTATITIKPYGEGEEAGEQTVTITRGSTDATSMTVDPVEINAPENGGSFSINVSSNAQWRVYKTWDMDWVTFTGATEGSNDGSFGIAIEAATSTDAISGVITIEEVRQDNYKPVQVQVAVSREGKAAASLSVTPTTINAPAEGGEFPIEIKSNYPWTANLVGTKIFSASTTSGDGNATMNITVKPTTEEKEATGSITIKTSFGGEQARINIKRAAYVAPEPQIRLYPNRVSATAAGGEFTINVTANCAWTASSSNPDIATVSPDAGNGSGSLQVIVSPAVPNAGSKALIYVKSSDGTMSDTVVVNREAYKTNLVQKPFSVSSSKRVYFSPGNLQYTQSTGKWSFAPYQYTCLGLAGGIWELFGFGTGENPTATTVTFNDISDLTFWDNNAITYQGNTYPAGTWHILSDDKWRYVLNTRPNAAQRKGAATVNNIKGYVLLPDEWNVPAGLAFTANTNNFAVNMFSDVEWAKMEAEGAVFLPATGWRYEYGLTDYKTAGHYWALGIDTESAGFGSVYMLPTYVHFYFNSSTDNGCAVESGDHTFHHGLCVRLVRDAN